MCMRERLVHSYGKEVMKVGDELREYYHSSTLKVPEAHLAQPVAFVLRASVTAHF